ncbi:ROK family protein [Streptomyces sp. NRRL B-24484]|uniref:ROK family protein n=1 Tax=Streptomyces sp. NRRL B-24484 TaxID=1463833 RepID=UPI0004C07E01|nr:ROK family protein [Streptomyces sp. NRRL B-24484]
MIALDLGAAFVTGTVLLANRPVDTERWATHTERGAAAVVDTLLACGNRLVGRARSHGVRVSAVGLALPGCALRSRSGGACSPIGEGDGTAVGPWIEEQLDLPVVVRDRTAAAGYAEAHLGAGAGAARLLYLQAELSTGTAFILNGRLPAVDPALPTRAASHECHPRPGGPCGCSAPGRCTAGCTAGPAGMLIRAARHCRPDRIVIDATPLSTQRLGAALRLARVGGPDNGPPAPLAPARLQFRAACIGAALAARAAAT